MALTPSGAMIQVNTAGRVSWLWARRSIAAMLAARRAGGRRRGVSRADPIHAAIAAHARLCGPGWRPSDDVHAAAGHEHVAVERVVDQLILPRVRRAGRDRPL